MPTYDYQCSSCNEVIEIFHSIKDSPKRKCPQCSNLTLKRLISGGAGVLFKGDGFYVNDSKSVSSAKKADVKAADKKPDSTSGSNTESTPNKEKKEHSSSDVSSKQKAKETSTTDKKSSVT